MEEKKEKSLTVFVRYKKIVRNHPLLSDITLERGSIIKVNDLEEINQEFGTNILNVKILLVDGQAV